MSRKHKRHHDAEEPAAPAGESPGKASDEVPGQSPNETSGEISGEISVELKGDVPPRPPPMERDVNRIDVPSLPEHPFPVVDGPRLNRFQAVIKRSVLSAIQRHGATRPDVEVCGVLVGNLFRDRAGAFLYVESIVRGDFAANKEAQVTFTAQTWQHIQEQMDLKHPDEKILGWYHTHPGFGIFLSKMDLFIHENFFNLPWQTAFVYDPKSKEEGLFVWRAGVAEREPFLVEEDAGAVINDQATPTPGESALPETGASAAALVEIKKRLKRLEGRNRSMIVAMIMLTLLAAAWPFVLYTIMTGVVLAPTAASKHHKTAATAPATNSSVVDPKSDPRETSPVTLPASGMRAP
jgi:proteasome lid subunit RPN8/RPN11